MVGALTEAALAVADPGSGLASATMASRPPHPSFPISRLAVTKCRRRQQQSSMDLQESKKEKEKKKKVGCRIGPYEDPQDARGPPDAGMLLVPRREILGDGALRNITPPERWSDILLGKPVLDSSCFSAAPRPDLPSSAVPSKALFASPDVHFRCPLLEQGGA